MRLSRIVTCGVAGLAVCGVLGMLPASVQASSPSIPTWTKQAPAASPPARSVASMAYDAATGTVVLFGGIDIDGGVLGDTWTWNGTTWTKQHPATSPPARDGAVMAYDAATSNVVMFGGGSTVTFGDTWTWE